MRRGFAVVLALLLTVICGCQTTESKKSFDQGRELYAQNRIEEAVALYEDAIRQEPDNQEYKDALKKAKEQVVGRNIDKAKSYLDAKPMTFDQLKRAQAELDKALKLSPDNENAARLSGQVKSEMDGLNKKAEGLYSAAGKSMDTNEWGAAIAKLREIKAFYPNYLDLPIKLAMAEANSINYYIKESDKYKAKEDWENVVRTLMFARDIKPGDADVAARIKEAESKNSPEYYVGKAEDAAKRKDWDTAMLYISKANALGPRGAAADRIERLQKDSTAYFIGKAEQGFAEQRLYTAYTNLASAIELRPAVKRDQKAVELMQQLVTAMVAKGESYEATDLLGNAFVWYDKALKLSSGNRELFTKTQAVKDKIRQRVVKKIAIMDFTPPSNNPDSGRLITDSLLSYLTKNTTGDVKILARDVLGSILKEIELGQAGLSDIVSAKKAGKLKGTDVFIFGNVLQYNVEKNVDEGFKVVNAVVGKRSIPNPAYQSWMASRPRSGDDDLKSAPPQFIEEEIRETHKYKVGVHKKTASVKVSFRVIDVEEGETVIAKTLNNKKEAEDNYSEGVDFANIAYKAVKLPSDTDMFEQVVEATVSELGYAVLSRFQNLQLLYSNNAQLLRKKGEQERAVEKYVDAIHVEELKNTSSPVSDNAKKEIEQILKGMAL
ncbi:MAG: hypothetical protein EPN22_05995 [Nitrospirae bacterium]|nr:MAG: hypothetical protein EPN22_05995 [Nitrospirota bacterium]